jgi:hypothetical protein
MADVDREIAALKAEVRRLQATIDEELPAIRASLSQPRATMRALLECPHCGGRRVLEAEKVADRTDAGDVPLAVASKGFWVRKPVGALSCWICASCGFAEWYVISPEQLEVDGQTIAEHTIDDADQGPYR